MRPSGSQNEFVNLFWMVESEQLRHPAAHGMTDDHRVFRSEMIHERDNILGKHRRRIVDRRFARLAGTAVVMDDHAVVAGKFSDLVDFPYLAVACGLA